MLHCKYTIGPNVTHSGTLRQCDKLSHMPAWHGFLSKFCQFVSLWRSDAVVCNAFSYHQKWCCILEENVLSHCWTLGSIAFFVTHCYSILPNIMASFYLFDITVQSLYSMNAYNLKTKTYCRKQEISAECLWRPIFAKITPFSNSCKGTTNWSSTWISQNMQYTYYLPDKTFCRNPQGFEKVFL